MTRVECEYDPPTERERLTDDMDYPKRCSRRRHRRRSSLTTSVSLDINEPVCGTYLSEQSIGVDFRILLKQGLNFRQRGVHWGLLLGRRLVRLRHTTLGARARGSTGVVRGRWSLARGRGGLARGRGAFPRSGAGGGITTVGGSGSGGLPLLLLKGNLHVAEATVGGVGVDPSGSAHGLPVDLRSEMSAQSGHGYGARTQEMR